MIKTTHIGSLPFQNKKDADLFNHLFDLPVMYSLPLMNNSQFMLEQVLGHYKEYSIEITQRNIELYNVDSIKDYKHFKFQMAGPITLIKYLKLDDGSEILTFLNWYSDQLKKMFTSELSRRCYFFLDEPSLFLSNKGQYNLLNDFVLDLKDSFYKIGLHCCSEMDLNLLNVKDLNGLSIESKYIDKLDLSQELDLFLGVLNTTDLNLDPIFDLPQINGDLFVTPHCGLAFTEIQKMHLVSINLTKWANMAQAR